MSSERRGGNGLEGSEVLTHQFLCAQLSLLLLQDLCERDFLENHSHTALEEGVADLSRTWGADTQELRQQGVSPWGDAAKLTAAPPSTGTGNEENDEGQNSRRGRGRRESEVREEEEWTDL